MAPAERIKTRHGGLFATGMDDREMIEIGGDSGDWEKDRRQDQPHRTDRHHAPAGRGNPGRGARLLDVAGFDHLPSQQIVLTGGASQMPGLDGLAARILGSRVRLGRPCGCRACRRPPPDRPLPRPWALCLFAAHPQDEWWDFEIPAERYPARSLRRAFRWFKDNW
jgi:cell division protein FtsA